MTKKLIRAWAVVGADGLIRDFLLTKQDAISAALLIKSGLSIIELREVGKTTNKKKRET